MDDYTTPAAAGKSESGAAEANHFEINGNPEPLPPLDAGEAVRLLEWLRPGGPWHLSLSDPMKARGGDGAFKTEEVRGADQARDLIGGRGRMMNVYYGVNPWRAGLRKKASKADVTRVAFVQADLDPKDSEAPDDAKAMYREALDEFAARFGLKPSAEID